MTDFHFISLQCPTEGCQHRDEIWHIRVEFNGPFYKLEHWRCKGCGMEPAEIARY